MDLEVLKVIGGGGLAASLLFLIYLVGTKLVAAIDRLGVKVDDHTKTDVEHHADVKEEIVAMRATIETMGWQERTPVDLPAHRRPTPAPGVPAGYHGPQRPKTQGGGR
jgi:hypothetical protein